VAERHGAGPRQREHAGETRKANALGKCVPSSRSPNPSQANRLDYDCVKALAATLGRPAHTLIEGVTIDDFHAYLPMHDYIYAPTREHWPAGSVNARIPPVPLLDVGGKPVLDKNGNHKTMAASTWLDRNRSVEQMTWAPGEPMLIKDRLVSDGGWIARPHLQSVSAARSRASCR
jgi:hypothetical protein